MDVDKALRKLNAASEVAKTALVRSVNSAIVTGRVAAIREIQSNGFRFKANTIRDRLRLRKAAYNGDVIVASIETSGRPIPLIKFDVFPKPSRRGNGFNRPAVGIYAKVLGKSYGGSHVFYARMKSGHVGVFKRVSAARTPLEQQYGPTLAEALGYNPVTQSTQIAFNAQFGKALKQQLGAAMH